MRAHAGGAARTVSRGPTRARPRLGHKARRGREEADDVWPPPASDRLGRCARERGWAGAGDEGTREGAEGLPADFAVLGRDESWAGKLAGFGFLLPFFSITIPFLIQPNKN
jgi:hypothetical protein